MAHQTQYPTVNVCINNHKIKMLVDTDNQLSVLNAAWMQRNKNYFKNMPILPVTNINIITATNKRKKVRKEAHVTICLLYTSRCV